MSGVFESIGSAAPTSIHGHDLVAWVSDPHIEHFLLFISIAISTADLNRFVFGLPLDLLGSGGNTLVSLPCIKMTNEHGLARKYILLT